MKSWKNLEKTVAKALGGIRRTRVNYGESCEDVYHKDYTVECKYGLQVPKYACVDRLVRLNKEYILIPSKHWGWIESYCRLKCNYDLGFLRKGMAQAQQYNEDKIPLLCLKRPRMIGFTIVMWWSDYCKSSSTASNTSTSACSSANMLC